MLGIKTAALPASLRRTNQRTVISLLFRMGSASRADLAKAAGISQPTAGKIITELLELGILRQASSAPNGHPEGHTAERPRLGRPGQLLRLDDERPRFMAIELGVSQTRMSALPVAVKLEDEWGFELPTPSSPADWVRELKKVVAKIPQTHLWGVLISVPGIVDETAGRVLFSPNLHWLEKANLPQLVRQLCAAPVLIVQEIRALASGQLTAQPSVEDFFLVDFGQGVGGAIASEGKLYSHPMPLSGEFGHSPVAGNRRPCGCGAVGCLETLVSERGLLESFADAHHLKAPSWKSLVAHVAEHGVEPWLADTLDTTAKVIAGALNVLGIHHVVVTGNLAELPASVMGRLSAEIQKGAMWARFGKVLCEGAPHRRAAGLVAVGIDRLVLPAEEAPVISWPGTRLENRERKIPREA